VYSTDLDLVVYSKRAAFLVLSHILSRSVTDEVLTTEAFNSKQVILDDPLAFMKKHNFPLNPMRCAWFLYLHLWHLKWTSDEMNCACGADCSFYREVTPEEIEYRLLQKRTQVLEGVAQLLRPSEWPWIVGYSLAGIVAFVGEF
jgi:hypothetical protein